MKGKLMKQGGRYVLYAEGGHKIACTSDSPHKKLSLKNCQAIGRGYDLEDLFNEVDESIDYHEFDFSSFRLGFQKALSILGDKKFSEEDVKKRVDLVKEQFRKDVDAYGKPKKIMSTLDTIYQSLQRSEWDVIVETKKVIDKTKIIGAVKGVKGSGNKITTYKQIPKLDADGCLVLKPKSK